jgi:flagellar basal-body rod protein FlgF
MENPTYIALSSQMALQRQMDVVANNLANMSTPAFKGERMMFAQYLVQPAGTSPLAFVQDVGTARDTRQGPITKTGNTLDLALQGSGYFSVETPLGTRYTRSGHFQLDAQGQIVTSQGYPVLGESGRPITVPTNATDILVGADGTISAGQGPVGKVGIVDFAQPQGLAAGANGLYVTDQTPQPAQQTTLVQGAIEESNVQPIVELTRLLGVSRSSSMIKSFLDAENTRQSNTIDKLSKVS